MVGAAKECGLRSYSDLFPTEEFGKYCDDIVNTAAWGGQLEVSWFTVIVGIKLFLNPTIVFTCFLAKPNFL